MRSTTLRALGAAIIWCALWLFWAPVAAEETAPRPPPAAARGESAVPLHPHSRSWIDRQGSRSFSAVEAAGDTLAWRLRRAEQTDRLDHGSLWVQFDVQPAGPSRWYLEVGAAGIDRVQLFYRDGAGQLVTQDAGDNQPTLLWPVPGRYPTFALSEEPRLTRYWLRIAHNRLDFAAPLTLYRDRTLMAKRNQEQFLLGAYFGLAALLALSSFAMGAAWRDRAFAAFGVYIVVVGASLLARAGVGAEHVWPDWPLWNELAVFAWPGLPVAAALWFTRVLTEPARLSRALDLGVWSLLAMVLAAVATDAVLRTRPTMLLVLVLSGVSLVVILVMLLWGWIDGHDPAVQLVTAAFLPVLLLALFPLALAFNLVPVSLLTRYAVFFGTALQLPIVYHALQMRGTRLRQSQGRAAALAHADPLTGLPHRQGFLERLETTLARSRSQQQGCALLGVRLVNLQPIAAEFGREVADKALVVAASNLRRCITHVDMAARVDEQEFALLLEGPTVDSKLAVSRAQLIIASGLRPSEALPGTVSLKFHVAVGMIPHGALDAHGTLQWLLEGVRVIAPDAKKSIRPLNF